MTTDTCLYDGCDRPRRALGLCQGHYDQVNRGGELRHLRVRRPGSISSPILSVEIVEDRTPLFPGLEDDELPVEICVAVAASRLAAPVLRERRRPDLLAVLASQGLRPVIREDLPGGLWHDEITTRGGIARITLACTRVGVPQP